MFLRLNRNSQGREYLQIVRSYRDNGKVKQEVLFTLGRLDLLQQSNQVDELVLALSRFATRQKLIDLSKDLSIEKVYYLGAVHVVRRMLERTGLWKVLEKIRGFHSRLGMEWERIIFGMILNRFMDPCSKKRWKEEWIERVYPEMLGIGVPSLSAVYRALDVLYLHRDELERALFERNGERDLFNQELDVVFYDTTTLRFESVDDERGELRRFGYSKERRSDCTQVVLGLLIDEDGIPVGYELFPGNTYESKSLPQILEKLKNKYQIRRIIFVADRGMISKDNLWELRQAKFEFIVGMRLWSLPEDEQKKVLEWQGYRALNKEETAFIREIPYHGDRLILSWTQERADRDAQVRNDILEKIRAQINKDPKPKQFVTHKGYRQYLKGLEEGKPELDYPAIALAQKRDGFFGVLTNIPKEKLGDEEVYSRYKDLWRIEDAFGEIKGPLKTRPMFHWTDRRIQAHVLICLMAYSLEAVITRSLRQKKSAFTAGELFRALNEVYAVAVKVRGVTAWVRNEILGVAAKGYQFLNLRPPERVLKIEKESVVTQN